MTSSPYSPPVNRLLTLGDCRRQKAWPDYPAQFGLTAEYIPELIRMATDKELNWGDPDSREVWAPVHAWRALGQLKAEAAINPLIRLFHELEEFDWTGSEMPPVFALIGPVAIPALKNYLANNSYESIYRSTAAICLGEMAQAHPEARNDCVQILADQLAKHKKNDPEFNGFLVHELLTLKAVEAAPVMEQAFAADRVDITINGDWNEVQVALGLKTRAEVPERRISITEFFDPASSPQLTKTAPQGFGATNSSSTKSTKKKKRK
jgi:hypothetical protein